MVAAAAVLFASSAARAEERSVSRALTVGATVTSHCNVSTAGVTVVDGVVVDTSGAVACASGAQPQVTAGYEVVGTTTAVASSTTTGSTDAQERLVVTVQF